MKNGFTLAETLITLVIIGIVVAITVPAVMNNINSKQKEEKVRNVYQKLSKSTDKMLGVSGMNGYSSTEEFLNVFKNHLSISKICKPENIQECWGSKQVTLTDGEKYDISKVKTTKELKIPKDDTHSGFKDIMSFVMNDGTPFIVSYNTECDMSLSDGRNWVGDKSSSTNCLAGVFDYNGGKKPNKLTDDVLNFNASGGLGPDCAFKVNGNCYLAPQGTTSPMSQEDCEAQKSELGLQYCRNDNRNDYYATAAKMCGGRDNIISSADLQKIADEIYPSLTIKSIGVTYCNGVDSSENCKDNDAAIKYGLGTANSSVWAWSSSENNDPIQAYRRYFHPYGSNYLDYGGDIRGNSAGLVICKGD